MSGKLITTPSATLLVGEIVDRYGSVGAFCDQLRHDLDDPTVELPLIRLPAPPRNTGHSARRAAATVRYREREAMYAREPHDASTANVVEPAARRSLWHRFLAWF